MSTREHFVYRVYDAAGRVIYVGRTRRPDARWQVHRSQKRDMVHQAHSCRMAGPYKYETANRIEAHLIHVHSPAFNTYGRGYVNCPCGCEEGEAVA